MNATVFFNATKLAQKPAAIGFLAVIGLGFISSIAVALSTLLALLTPALITATKAVIFGYPLFIAGVIALNIKQQCQTKEAPTIAMLPPYKPYQKRIEQVEIVNKTLIKPPPSESIFKLHLASKQPTCQKQILKEIQLPENQPKPQIKETIKLTETPTVRSFKPLHYRLAATLICWQAINRTAELLNDIKASEMKSIAAKLKISKYRNMNKTQLLVAISEKDFTEIAA